MFLPVRFAMNRFARRPVVWAAVLAIGSAVQAQPVLEFGFDPNTLVVNSINLTGTLNFTAAVNYTYSPGIQVRIFDLYSTVSGQVSGATIGGTFKLSPNSSGQPGSFYSLTSPNSNLGGSTSGGDVIFWNSENYSFTSGQVLTLSGQSAATTNANFPNNPLLAPTSGSYAIYLASQWDGTLLTVPMNITVAGLAIPEPSLFAMLGGLAALAIAAYCRRGRR